MKFNLKEKKKNRTKINVELTTEFTSKKNSYHRIRRKLIFLDKKMTKKT